MLSSQLPLLRAEGSKNYVQLLRLQKTTILVETIVLVEYKGLTIFSTKPVGCCILFLIPPRLYTTDTNYAPLRRSSESLVQCHT